MKKIILSYFFPPGSTGASTVMYNFCKNLAKDDYVVVTAGDAFLSKLGEYDPSYCINGNIRKLPINDSTIKSRAKFFLFSLFNVLSNHTEFNFDCILVVYPYFTDLLSGYVLSRIFNRPLIIYMHDLFSEVRQEALTYPLWFFLETKVLSSAAGILVMNEKYVTHYAKRDLKNMVLFPPTISSVKSNVPIQTSQRSKEDRNYRIVFTGSVYGAHADAIICFLDAVKKTEGVEAKFAFSHYGLTKLMEERLKEVDVGFLSKQKCLDLQRSADVLLLPLAFDSPYPEEVEVAFPCKLLEYLAVGKPVLAIVPENSFVASFVKEHNIGIVVTKPSSEEILQALARLKDPETRELYSTNSKETVKLFDSKIWSEKLDKILEEIYAKWFNKPRH